MMKTMTRSLGSIAAVVYLAGSVQSAGSQRITQQPFGTTPDGKAVTLYTLTNERGMQALITNYGGIMTVLKVPDRRGRLGDVVLGYDNLADYIKDSPYFGSLIGRYGNRI